MPSAVTDAPRYAQHTSLRGQFQPVSGFDFQRGHAIGQQRARARQRLREQFIFARVTRGAHGRDNAAASTRDLFVAGAIEAQIEFLRTVAAKNQMRVAIDQPRRNQRAIEVMHFPRRCADAAGRSHIAPIQTMLAVLAGNRRFGQQAVTGFADKRCQRCVGQQQIPVHRSDSFADVGVGATGSP